MRLLSARDVVSKKNAQHEVDLYEAHKARKRLIAETDELKKFKDGIGPERKREIRDHMNFCQNLERQKALMLKEIEELENIKLHAMKPIDDIKMEVMEREERVSDAEKELSDRRKSFNDRVELFNKKIVILEDKEQDVAHRDALASANYLKSERMVNKMSEDEEEMAEIRKILGVREEKLKDWAITLSDRENAVQAKLEAISSKEKYVAKTLKIIESKQAALQSAFKEFNKK